MSRLDVFDSEPTVGPCCFISCCWLPFWICLDSEKRKQFKNGHYFSKASDDMQRDCLTIMEMWNFIIVNFVVRIVTAVGLPRLLRHV